MCGPRSRPRAVLAGLVGLVGVALLAGCAGPPPDPGMPPAPSAGQAPATASPSPPPSPPCPAALPVGAVTWVERSDGVALRVVPSAQLRACGGPFRTVEDPPPGWSDPLGEAPTADSPGMLEQYRCHLELASGADEWHLEPWRPVVDDGVMLAAACNPLP
ncbi:DUF2599 domain-containing protein [Ornithinimicrobium cerasi]|uniref:DUF2599 domain-containing protein n=1 Tax=Ornithinimicrobium cerasi TaxID=2248773 RepID=UPI000F00F5E7|nr:DUF2599 domain-containing protein [Ornithinimicrobium cerasi]